jgi:hypothetical protein
MGVPCRPCEMDELEAIRRGLREGGSACCHVAASGPRSLSRPPRAGAVVAIGGDETRRHAEPGKATARGVKRALILSSCALLLHKLAVAKSPRRVCRARSQVASSLLANGHAKAKKPSGAAPAWVWREITVQFTFPPPASSQVDSSSAAPPAGASACSCLLRWLAAVVVSAKQQAREWIWEKDMKVHVGNSASSPSAPLDS